jgi:hypothetical protein
VISFGFGLAEMGDCEDRKGKMNRRETGLVWYGMVWYDIHSPRERPCPPGGCESSCLSCLSVLHRSGVGGLGGSSLLV